jgi:hypothetical protein
VHLDDSAPHAAAGAQIATYAAAKLGLPSEAMIGLKGLFQATESTPTYCSSP